MGRYREKSPIIDAYQVSNKMEPLPEWILNGLYEGKLLRDGQGRWYVSSNNGSGFILTGGWIIKDKNGYFYSRSDENFKSVYELIDEPKSKAVKPPKEVDHLEAMKCGGDVKDAWDHYVHNVWNKGV